MVLQPCRECGQQISTEADSCPHCGIRNPGTPTPLVEDQSLATERPGGSVRDVTLFAGWVCFGLGMLFMVLSLGLIFVYVPLLLAAFVLSIVVMTRGRTWAGVTLLVIATLVPTVAWFALLAWGIDRAFDTDGGASVSVRAFDATAKSDVRNAMAAEEAYFADTQTYAPNSLATGWFTTSAGVTISASAASSAGYAVTASHFASSNSYWVEVGTRSSIEGRVQQN